MVFGLWVAVAVAVGVGVTSGLMAGLIVAVLVHLALRWALPHRTNHTPPPAATTQQQHESVQSQLAELRAQLQALRATAAGHQQQALQPSQAQAPAREGGGGDGEADSVCSSNSDGLAFDVFVSYRKGSLEDMAEKLALALVEHDPHWKLTLFWDKRILIPQESFQDWILRSGCVIALLSSATLSPITTLGEDEEDVLLTEIELAVDKLEEGADEGVAVMPVLVGSVGEGGRVVPCAHTNPSAYPDHHSRTCKTRTIRETMRRLFRAESTHISPHDIEPTARHLARLLSRRYRRASLPLCAPSAPLPSLSQPRRRVGNEVWDPCPPETLQYGPDTPPQRFVRGLSREGSDVPLKRWRENVRWRQSNGVDDILDEPQLNYETIKRFHPHYYVGRARDGRVLYVERPGESDFVGLQRQGVSNDDCVRHFVFISEVCYRVLDKSPDATSINIIDARNLTVADVAGQRLEVFKKVSQVTQAYYVERCGTIFVLNAGWLFRAVWGLLSPFVNQSTRAKMRIHGSDYQHALCELAGAENIPTEFGGSDPTPLGQHDMERIILEHVRDVIARGKTKPGASSPSPSPSPSSSASSLPPSPRRANGAGKAGNGVGRGDAPERGGKGPNQDNSP